MTNLLFIDGEGAVEGAVEAPAQAQTNNNVEIITVDGKETSADVREQQPQPGGGMGFWIMIILMIGVMYLFMWRPESKRRKAMAKFREGLKKGDKIITAGGIYGVVKEVKENSILVEVDSNVTLRVDKNMVVGDPSQAQQTK